MPRICPLTHNRATNQHENFVSIVCASNITSTPIIVIENLTAHPLSARGRERANRDSTTRTETGNAWEQSQGFVLKSRHCPPSRRTIYRGRMLNFMNSTNSVDTVGFRCSDGPSLYVKTERELRLSLSMGEAAEISAMEGGFPIDCEGWGE